jgi:hypothetical protein
MAPLVLRLFYATPRDLGKDFRYHLSILISLYKTGGASQPYPQVNRALILFRVENTVSHQAIIDDPVLRQTR